MDYNYTFIFLSLSTLIIFTYKRGWLLHLRTAIRVAIWNGILFMFGLGFLYFSFGDQDLVVLLGVPIFSQLIFSIMVTVFRKIYDRDPVDTFWTMDIKLMRDGVFNFIFIILGGFFPIILLEWLLELYLR
jgi:hypothetical protein